MTDTTTTTTQHWLLAKYSRSRSLLDAAPRPSTASSNNAPGSVAGQASDDSIHSQPQLALRLDTTFASSPSSSTPSSNTAHPLRMVLSVTFDPLFRDPDRGGTQQPLLLDSLDLTAFSSREIRTHTPSDQLPLKAVYRDAVLGLRYLALSHHARTAPNQPEVEFRRLQAKFMSTAERQRFVEAVGALVPAKPAVKADPAPVAPPAPAAKKLKVGPPRPSSSTKPVKPPAKKVATPRSRKKQPAKKAQPHPHDTPSPPALSTAHDPLPASSPAPPSRPGPAPLAHHHLPTSSTPRLPPHLSTLLPNLATASTSTASQLLAALPPHELEQLLQDALLEDGFEQLVERVQGTLMGG